MATDPSWVAPGGSWGRLEAVLGLPGAPVPEGPREAPGGALGGHFGGHFCSRALRHEKTWKINKLTQFSKGVFTRDFKTFLRLAGGAGARAHLENIGFRLEGVAILAYRPFSRGTKKQGNC